MTPSTFAIATLAVMYMVCFLVEAAFAAADPDKRPVNNDMPSRIA